MDIGPRTLFRFEYSLKTKWMLDPVYFRDDKMGDGLSYTFSFWTFRDNGPRTLSRFGCFAMTKWAMAAVRFFHLR